MTEMGGWFFGGSGPQYQPLPTDDLLSNRNRNSQFKFDSIFDFQQGFDTDRSKFRSVFKYEEQKDHVEADLYSSVTAGSDTPPPLVVIYWALTLLSYLLFFVFLPFTYWFCVVKLGESDKLVVFRLGKLQGVKGPGRILTFPWLDRTKRVDTRASAFSVPPQQFISQDGAIVEMGAEVQYAIVDVETMVREVADHQDILRSLGNTFLIKIVTKMSLNKMLKDRRIAAQRVMDEMNQQVRKWGIDIRIVSLSDPKVLKKPEEKSAMGPILKNMGLKQEQEFPSPEQFIRTAYGGEETGTSDAEALNQLASAVGGFIKKSKEEGKGLDLASMAHMMGSQVESLPTLGEDLRQAHLAHPPNINIQSSNATSKSGWHRCLESILLSDSSVMEKEATGLYEVQVLETELGTETFHIDITLASKNVRKVGSETYSLGAPDVSVSITSSDLASVIQGTLSPLQAYLTGRISASGDVKKLMFFDKLSSRGHRPGGMFTV